MHLFYMKSNAKQKEKPLVGSSKYGQAKPGDVVEIHLTKVIYQGTLLESPVSEKNIILLKLENGYNIGFNKKDVLEIKKIKTPQIYDEKFEIKKQLNKPNIALIITGGTIASKYDSKTGGVKYLTNIQEFLKFYPEILEIANVVKIENPFMVWSEDMAPKHWKEIAKTCEKLLNDSNIKGIIITHGTDFLHYTSAALSFMLKNLNKPIVLTYSQRSIDRGSSDARLNLICAARVATSDIKKVTLVGHASEDDNFCYALSGTKVRKMHTSRRDAFKPINTQPIARVWPDKIEILNPNYLNNKSKLKSKPKSDTKFQDKVALIKFYPGQTPDILDYYHKQGFKGVVVEVAGIGQVATESKHSWVKKVSELSKKGFIICATSQTIYGRLHPYVYSSGRKLLNAGMIYLEDMLSETALVKLGWVLAKTQNKEEVKKIMLENIAGEFNKRLEK
jgi:glutamyl-tRNA(Gln) amidotransferase subunit D